ncbi:PD-(D/E)XK nuclease superfamily protein [Marinitoga hydrogenitolerans DSM 16785]|uniref:PD-(D/E)XK nuclease superfamily protein n=1 Tax=Marinitoga hydrogenitolerans (strain DSM 16785 / JCM 12826 / AT1271) TaxID=1122195 RepID=A0A1M4YVH1_MARH1|nr:PD-(D/E)XK nuclease family protein [Marinitoga hydrogenitolerans]SHF09346.1 PD-(D/E)XK nuclease superfamily protein [Marinitoga hydrogenitolerans DSM 16785]
MKKAKIIDLNKNHFDEIADFILPLYEKDPMEFLYIGPSGDYVKQIAEAVTRKTNKTLNRDAFRVINQYIVELFKKHEPSSLFIDRDFLKAYIANELEDLIEKEKNNIQFEKYLKTLSKSKFSIEYLLEIFEKKWEISRISDKGILESNELYMEMDKDIESDDNLFKLYKHLEEKLEDILNTKFDNSKSINKNYDQISIYKWFYEEFEGKKLGKTLIIGGFFDLPPILINVLNKLFSLFDNVYFLAWSLNDDDSFDSLKKIYNFLRNNDFDIEEKKIPLKKLFKDTVFFKAEFKNNILEIENIAKEIKRKILYENYVPKDFGIVVPDFQTANSLADFFEEIKVPYRLKNDISLSESLVVNKLLLPLKVKYSGYEVDDLLALIETGYAGERTLSIDEIEELLKSLNLYYDYPKSSLKSRKEKWIKRIEEKLNEVKKELLSSDEKERLEKSKKELDELKNIFFNLFDLLGKLDKKELELSYYRNLLNNWINEKVIDISNIEKVESELNALYKFQEVLLKTEKNLEKLISGNISLSKYYNILSSLIETEKYRISEKYSNTVEIFTLNDSRFIHKKFKIFISFSDNNYPSIGINPLLSYITKNDYYSKISELQFRENMYISMLFADNVIITYPKATISGEEISISPYENDLKKLFEIKEYTFFSKSEEIIPINTNEIYSLEQAVLYYTYNNLNSNMEEINNIINQINELKISKKIFSWNLGESIKLKNISHNKISTYVDCPFKYYLKYIAEIKTNKDFSIFYVGNLKHKIMKKLFDKYSTYNSIKSLVDNKDELYNEIKRIANEEWDKSGVEELRTYKIIKEIEIEVISNELSNVVDTLISLYIFFGSPRSKNKEALSLKYQKIIESEYSIKGEYNKYNLISRIDRIDEMNENLNFELKEKKKKNIFELKPSKKEERKSYSIIDYKNKTSFQTEQLLFYYLTLLNNKDIWKEKVANNPVFLSFLPMSKENDKYKSLKWIKIENNFVYIKYPGNSNAYEKIDFKEFEKWLDNIINSIKNTNFIPAFSNKKELLKYRFLDELSIKGYSVQNSNEKYYSCKIGNEGKCEFYRFCSLFQWLENITLKERKHLTKDDIKLLRGELID